MRSTVRVNPVVSNEKYLHHIYIYIHAISYWRNYLSRNYLPTGTPQLPHKCFLWETAVVANFIEELPSHKNPTTTPQVFLVGASGCASGCGNLDKINDFFSASTIRGLPHKDSPKVPTRSTQLHHKVLTTSPQVFLVGANGCADLLGFFSFSMVSGSPGSDPHKYPKSPHKYPHKSAPQVSPQVISLQFSIVLSIQYSICILIYIYIYISRYEVETMSWPCVLHRWLSYTLKLTIQA